jgi:hypothetical protein
MKHSFRSKISLVGINPCIKVPKRITDKLIAKKGYIPVKGTIENHFFQQTLVPVKSEGYRLYVNGPMLKGAGVGVGDMVSFVIEQDNWERNQNHPMPKEFKKQLKEHGLLKMFEQLPPSRQKEINRYLNNLKTKEALMKNVGRMINVLQGKEKSPLYRTNNG